MFGSRYCILLSSVESVCACNKRSYVLFQRLNVCWLVSSFLSRKVSKQGCVNDLLFLLHQRLTGFWRMAGDESKFKVYFKDEDSGEEQVRKLLLQPVPTFQEFESCLRRLLGETQCLFGPDQVLKIQYLDEDGDKVTLACDRELKQFYSDNPCKLYVQTCLPSRPTSRQRSPGCHDQALCTCCHRPVRGFRYKCIVCPHYDLCIK